METTHHNERTLKFVEMICKHPIFNATLRNAIQNNMYIDKNTIINTMTGFHLFTSEQMYKRRSQTVRSWIKWIILQIES